MNEPTDIKNITIEIEDDSNAGTNINVIDNQAAKSTTDLTSKSDNKFSDNCTTSLASPSGASYSYSCYETSSIATTPSISLSDPLNIPVIDICSSHILQFSNKTKVEDVLIKLRKSHCNSFIVTNEYNEFIKFYTQKDIYFKVIYYGKMNESFTLKDLIEMDEKSRIETQCVSYSNSLIDCLKIMKENNVESIAVSDDQKSISGIISLDDISDLLIQQIKMRRNPPRKLSPVEQKISNLFDSIFFQIFYIFIMIISILFSIFSATLHLLVFQVLSPMLIFILLFVASLRDKLKGMKHILKIDILETVCLSFAFIFGLLYVIVYVIEGNSEYLYFFTAGFLAIHVFLIFPFRFNETRKKMKHSSKKAVSRNKTRYQQDGFDLDLTYITNKCIAMSLPAEKIESLYRNPIGEVVRFFDTKHPGCYRIYNLCKERDYNIDYFHGNVVRFPIPDHNVPTLRIMYEFSKDAKSFLSSNPQNVIAVHCKGGKGRTGCMICAYLVNSGVCNNTDEALDRFASKRTYGETKNQGVTCPSQKRFVHYFEQFLEDLFIYYNNPIDIVTIKDEEMDELFNKRYNKEITIERITINNLPKMKDIRFRIVDYNGKQLYISSIMNIKALNKSQITIEPNLKVRNEFRFECKGKFYMWQHSYFVCERKIYNKQEIDGICNNINYPDNTCIEFIFKT